MPALKLKKGEIKVPTRRVIRMADRMHKLDATQRESYIARARMRLEAGHPSKNDAAVVLPLATRLPSPAGPFLVRVMVRGWSRAMTYSEYKH